MIGRLGPTAYPTLLRELPRTLALLDRVRASRTTHLLQAAGASDCGPNGAKETDNFSNASGGGLEFEATASSGNGGDVIGAVLKNGDRAVEIHVAFGDCNKLPIEVDKCPTAAGVANGRKLETTRSTTKVTEGGKVLYTVDTRERIETKARGQMADDAKLDFVDIDNIWTSQTLLGGRLYGPTTESGRAEKPVRVDMRSGRYDPTKTQVSASGTASPYTEKDLARFVGDVRFAFRQSEASWNQTGNDCAEIEFQPASNTLHLRRGQTGRLIARAVATRDGGTARARWTRQQASGATVTPAEVRGGRVPFNYVVTSQKGSVSVRLRVTSTAGVRVREWLQNKIELPEVWHGTVYPISSGTFRVRWLDTSHSESTEGTTDCKSEGSVEYALGPAWGHFDITLDTPEGRPPRAEYYFRGGAPTPMTYKKTQKCVSTARDGSKRTETTTSDEQLLGFGGPSFSRKMKVDDRTLDGKEGPHARNTWHFVGSG